MDNQVPVSQEPQVIEEQSSLSRMEQGGKSFRIIPRNEFEHSTMLLEPGKMPNKPEIMELIQKEIILANIQDDQLLRIYQLQFNAIIEFYDMGLWASVGENLYTKLMAELALSRAKGNAERIYQAGAIPNLTGGRVEGIGSFFQSSQRKREQEQRERENEGMMSKINGGQYQ